MSFMSVRGARKHLLAATVPLAALAFASSAQALSTVPAVSGGPTLTVTAPGVTFSGNTYTIAAASTGSLSFTLDGSNFDLSSPTISTGNVLQSPYIGGLCSTTLPDFDYAGAYAAVGGVNPAGWRPSTGAGSGTRQAGPTYWANTHGAVKSAACSSLIADQTLLSDSFTGSFSQAYTVPVCVDGSDYKITGTRQGPNGPVPYTINLGSVPNLHAFSYGAVGTTPFSDTLEQATNIAFTGITDPC